MNKKNNITEHPGDRNIKEINKHTEHRSVSSKLRIKSIETTADEERKEEERGARRAKKEEDKVRITKSTNVTKGEENAKENRREQILLKNGYESEDSGFDSENDGRKSEKEKYRKTPVETYEASDKSINLNRNRHDSDNLKTICFKCGKIKRMQDKIKDHKTKHDALQNNECNVCECTMKFEKSGKEHIVWDHIKGPRHQVRQMSANTEYLPRKNHRRSSARNCEDDSKTHIQDQQCQRKYLTG